MRTRQGSHSTARSMVRHAATILFCALAALGLMRCAEPVGIPTDSEMVLLERFAATENPSSDLLASVKPLLATERGQRMLESLRGRSVGAVPRFNHTGQPDYTVTSIPIEMNPTPTGTHSNLDDDDFTTGLLPIGFDFKFFGIAYSRINIATNGFVGFSASMGDGCCNGELIPNADGVNNIIAALWSDLTPDETGQIWYGMSGAAPNRRFVVHYRNVSFWPAGDANRIDVQVKLFEGSNVIEIHSLAVPPDGHQHTQGIENSAGTDAYFVSGRVAANFDLANDAVRFTPAGDDSPPVVTASVSGSVGDNDWYTSNVSVTWTVTDAESAIAATSGCGSVSVVSDQHATTYTCSATSGGGPASESVTVKRDATNPAVAFTGNAGTYTVDQSVDIVCSASDATSGLASADCPSVGGDAYTFGVGTSSLSASAADNAGNTGGASASFTVSVTPASLCNLVRRWVSHKGTANSLCQQLAAGAYDAFRNRVQTQSGKHVAADKAAILISLSNEL
ncbi:MAG: hypothetical protein ACR2L6_01985 [Gemmatimonadaceae bacterium]